MNMKVVIGVIVAVLVVGGGAAYFLLSGNKTAGDSVTTSAQKPNAALKAVKACDVFTLAEAKQLMGESATVGSNTSPASSDDINVDNCSYVNNATSIAAIRTATVMVRSALTDDGLQSNKEAFEAGGAANPSGATAVEGYGEKAYWDPATHQLAVLKDNMWLGIIYGGTNPTNNTLEDAKKLADFVAK